MELTIQVNNRKEYIARYLDIFCGGLDMTSKEHAFLCLIVEKYMEYTEAGIKEPYIGKLVFSKENFNEIKKELKISAQGLNNYKTQLKNKKVFIDKGSLTLNPLLYPRETITFNFKNNGRK